MSIGVLWKILETYWLIDSCSEKVCRHVARLLAGVAAPQAANLSVFQSHFSDLTFQVITLVLARIGIPVIGTVLLHLLYHGVECAWLGVFAATLAGYSDLEFSSRKHSKYM